ncbi:MAG: hypothetical protein ACJAU8_000139 [Candidatus Paceibacteria bacterium]|jgi:hypothetical protein
MDLSVEERESMKVLRKQLNVKLWKKSVLKLR